MSLPDAQAKGCALMALAENFGKPLSKGLLSVWLDLLAPYTVEQVEQACRKVMEEYDYKTLPPFAVLKKHLSTEPPKECLLSLKAGEEWSRLLDLIARYGRNRMPSLNRTTDAVLKSLGGWQTACDWTESELPYRRNDFLSLWEKFGKAAGGTGEDAESSSQRLKLVNGSRPAALPPSSEDNIFCPECGGSGWITGYKEGCPGEIAFPCVCLKTDRTVHQWTRAELARQGISFEPPASSSRPLSPEWERRKEAMLKRLASKRVTV